MAELEDIIKNSNEPEVVRAVVTQIKAYGDSTKKNFDDLRREYEELKKTVDSGFSDATQEAKFKKLSEAIITRQQALDEAIQKASADLTKRTDDLELAFKRPGAGDSSSHSEKDFLEAKSFLHSIDAVKGTGSRVDIPDSEVDPAALKTYAKLMQKYIRFDEKRLDEVERKAMLVGSDPDGGYVTVPQMASAILSRMFEMDPLRALASVETISTGAIEWLVDWDETQASWEEETKTVDADTSTAKLGKKRIAVFPLAARPAATQILLEDASINIESWLSAKAADKFSRVEAPAFVTGDGVGKPRGFLTYPNYSSSGVDQYGAIERVNMGNASAITADGFSRIKYSLIEQFLTRGTWLMNRLTVAEVTRLKDGQGQYLWTPGLRDDVTSTILGLPVRMATSMPVVGAGAYSVALADWKAAYMIVDRIGITLQRDPYTRKPFIEFYFRKRVGGDVINFQAIKLGVISA